MHRDEPRGPAPGQDRVRFANATNGFVCSDGGAHGVFAQGHDDQHDLGHHRDDDGQRRGRRRRRRRARMLDRIHQHRDGVQRHLRRRRSRRRRLQRQYGNPVHRNERMRSHDAHVHRRLHRRRRRERLDRLRLLRDPYGGRLPEHVLRRVRREWVEHACSPQAVEFYPNTPLSVATFTRTTSGSGASIQYAAYDATAGLAPGQTAVLFLSGSSASPNVPCPAGVQTAIPQGSMVQGTGLTRSFHITSDVPVAAYQMNTYGDGASVTGSTLLLPTSAWDTYYIAATAAPYSSVTMDSPVPSCFAYDVERRRVHRHVDGRSPRCSLCSTCCGKKERRSLARLPRARGTRTTSRRPPRRIRA